jgi:dTDP-4-dehydrorhamnose reductase
MADRRPIAVTGAGGRLGSALRAVSTSPLIGWDVPEHDLDRPESIEPLLERDRPGLVIHTAAMTLVDECARQPELAMRRNGAATGVLAEACRASGASLLVVSTNEVFAGDRSDGQGYVETDAVGPRNPYGASKLAGEVAATAAFGSAPGLWIVRTAWLYGPPGNDFPDKITAAADRLPDGEPLPVVADEWGSPTYTRDLALAILELVALTEGGLFHLVNPGVASRRDWAGRVLAARRPGRSTRPISATEFSRASAPPPWGVLDAARAQAAGLRLRSWQDALDDYLGAAVPHRRAGGMGNRPE